MEQATLTVDAERTSALAADALDATAISAINTAGQVTVLVESTAAAQGRFVEIRETLRRLIDKVRETPAVQRTVGQVTTLRVTGSLVLGGLKDFATIATDTAEATTLITLVPAGSVGIIIPPNGGLTNRVESALYTCIDEMEELVKKYDPA
jgi:hypothetical protein